ncbi:hypothetical protein B0H10DRAFT_2207053 [Mycena sp. CBHHK59/15]|nr:hypothetical protein B0H10DRAFT_2207053 [Mycena sp. CBHHK59/15]
MLSALFPLVFFGLAGLSSAIPARTYHNRSDDTPCRLKPPSLAPRAATVLNAGNDFTLGKVGNMTWTASGILQKGCGASAISNCYYMHLTSDASAMLDTSHLDSPASVTSGTSPPLLGSSTHFFHLMQVFGMSEQNPLVALDALKGRLTIMDYITPTCGSSCPSTALSDYQGVYTTHKISGKFGPSGNLKYSVVDAGGKQIINYSRTGGLGAAGGYIKFGTYRLTFTTMTTVNAMVGDWTFY